MPNTIEKADIKEVRLAAPVVSAPDSVNVKIELESTRRWHRVYRRTAGGGFYLNAHGGWNYLSDAAVDLFSHLLEG